VTDQVEAELKSLGTQALQDLMNNLTQAKSFAVEQAPEFCQQLIARGLWLNGATGGVLLAIALVLLGVAAISAYIIHRECRDGIGESREGVMIPCIFAAIISLVASIPTLICGLQYCRAALAVYVAPKVYLVEEIARMIK
jgi:hypothetical protein